MPSAVAHGSFEILSASPRVYYFPRFLGDDEIDALLEHAQANADGFERSFKPAVRLRSAAFVPFAEVHADPRLRAIVRRMSAETKLPLRHFHWLKMMRYVAPERESDALKDAQCVPPLLSSALLSRAARAPTSRAHHSLGPSRARAGTTRRTSTSTSGTRPSSCT